MKVTRIEIKDFNQFKNLDIDLTYPKGHAKEGQPLDKVCFIGQSGTGKTTLLKFLGGFVIPYVEVVESLLVEVKNAPQINNIKLEVFFNSEKIHITPFFENNSKELKFSRIFENGNDLDELTRKKANEYFDNNRSKLIYFPSNLDLKKNWIEDFSQKSGIWDFERIGIEQIWNTILQDVQSYHERFIKYKDQIFKEIEHSLDLESIKYAYSEFENWKLTTINPIINIADNCLDFLLKPFNLRVKREFEFTKKEDIGFINIEDFNGNEVPFDLWSTGTRQLLYSTLPLYLLKPENTIILFDEPERSLYPDMQRMIIDFYSSLTKDSQFFYATHSPIIASSFEPWEIVELKLDENGHVYQDLYYKGERHVDNYHIVPQYLDYDTMLKNVFDLKETRPQIGIDKIGDVLMYKNHLFKLKKEGKTNTKEFKDLFDKYKRLAEQVAWDFNVLEDEKN
jgi:predicted ATP-dependent endonuclease of OLD family